MLCYEELEYEIDDNNISTWTIQNPHVWTRRCVPRVKNEVIQSAIEFL